MTSPGAGADVPFLDRARETASPETLRSGQWERLTAGVAEIWGSNPFWRERLRTAGLRDPRDLASWADFARLPRLTKAELAADQAAHPPFGTNLTHPLERYVRVFQTSGTTGPPIRWLETEAAWTWWARCWGFVLRGAGLGSQDRLFFPFSFGLFVGFWAGLEGARVLGALAIPGGGQDSPTRLHAMRELRATALVCTPSYALHLGEIARAQGVDPAALGVRTTVHAGEPGAGIPAVRQRIQALWGARAYDHAGMTEVGAYGFECVAQTGLHVNELEFVAEVLDPESGRPVAPGEIGELTLTNLGRWGAPVLRYSSGDRVRLDTSGCACGRTFARLEGGILGRVDDMLIVRGVNVFPSALEGIVRRFTVVEEFQIEVFRRGVLDEVRLLLEIDGSARPAEGVRDTVAQVAEAVRRDLGIRVEVTAVPARSLPRFELKARRVVRREESGG
ncbi:MAG TPA: AMP-binding protein [Methylomirabilota bacterium]|jgi:phenylacetate-CoA ligase|nr:AMP-binding protein [Methylomirabilota bacterium]